VFQDVMAEPATSGRFVVALTHHVFWPSFVGVIDAKGDFEVRFLSPGHIYRVNRFVREGSGLVVASGVNNEFESAAVAIIDERAPAAVAPQSGASAYTYTLAHDLRGYPVRYLLFPRTEVNRMLGGRLNQAERVIPTEGGAYELSVREHHDPIRPRLVYRLSPDFEPVSVTFSEGYRHAHNELERQGRLDHPFEACPELRDGLTARVWEPATSWRDVRVAASF
jgi:hypothetical protein